MTLTIEVPTAAAAIEGKSPRQLAWMRFKRDKVAVTAGVVVVLYLLIAIFAMRINFSDSR